MGEKGQNFQKEPQVQMSLCFTHLGVPEMGNTEET